MEGTQPDHRDIYLTVALICHLASPRVFSMTFYPKYWVIANLEHVSKLSLFLCLKKLGMASFQLK
jgi:hypothetical protein